MDDTRPQSNLSETRTRSNTKLVATLVLVPAVPMLLLSIASLGLFYLAPVRFGALISRLPGESLIRTALVFAPATLFAIVVLAVLYAVEQPLDMPVSVRARRSEKPLRQILPRASQWLLPPVVAASILTLGLWALSFISPSRYDRLLAPLPGDSYWKPLVPYAPWLLFAMTLLLAYLAFNPQERERAPWYRRGFGGRSLLDNAVSALLTFAVPALLATSGALIAYMLRPERVSSYLERLPYDSLVRLLLIFAPPTLFAVVILAALFLLSSRRERELARVAVDAEDAIQIPERVRGTLAMGVLVVGLTLSAFLGLGAFGAVAYILFR